MLEPGLRWLPGVCKIIGWNPGRTLLASTVALLFAWPPVARATVYGWKGEGGVLVLSNDPSEVPEDQLASAQKFTAKPAPRPVTDEQAPHPPTTEAAQVDAYQRGFDAGLQAAEREVALIGELALSVLAAAPQTPPAPIVIEQSAPPIAPDVLSDYAPPYYGFAGPYVPYPFPYAFAVSFVPRRHFFPGAGGRRFVPFFPHGQLSRAWTGRMR